MAKKASKKGSIGFGLFLVIGAIVASAMRLSGIGPPSSKSGDDIGYWIGTCFGIILGIVLIAQGLSSRKKAPPTKLDWSDVNDTSR